MSYGPPHRQNAPRKKPEARSWDRVHFTVPANYLLKQTYRDCLGETLGLTDSPKLQLMGQEDTDLHIICRPSQFARFIVLRHIKYGEQNNMACLDMKLVIPEIQEDPPWDVSGNPNTAGHTDAEGTQQVRRT